MTLTIIARLLSLLLAVVVISKTLVSYSQRKESLQMLLFWVITWGGIIVLTFFPVLVDRIIGDARIGIGTILGVGLVFVYFVTYRVYVKTDKNEREIEKLTRILALKEEQQENNKDSNR